MSNELIEKFKLDNKTFVPKENDILGEIMLSNCAIQCKLSNISFNEIDIKTKFLDAKEFLSIKCNFWEISNEVIVPKIKSNRGRKKISTNQKPKKQLGNGTNFRSQISFKIPYNNYYYNIKLFVNGCVQIPGLKSIEKVNEVIECLEKIMKYFSESKPQIISISPTMKNYKTAINIPGKFLNLINLKVIITENKLAYNKKLYKPIDNSYSTCDEQLEFYRRLFDIKYDRMEETKMTIIFDIDGKKKMTVKLFYSGKINFLGKFDNHYVALVYGYFVSIVKHHRNTLVVEKGIAISEEKNLELPTQTL